MANLNPTCKHCGRKCVFIGISGSASAVCPAECSACVTCRHPDASLDLHRAELVDTSHADIDSTWLVEYRRRVTLQCTKCGVQTTTEAAVGGA